jgi:hypothetical protein
MRPPRQYEGGRRYRHRPIEVKGGASYIASITGEWQRTVAPSQVIAFKSCQAYYVREAEGDLAEAPPSVSVAIGRAVHEQIAKPAAERRSVAAVIAASPNIPKEQRAGAVRAVQEMVATATKHEKREAPKTQQLVREPKALFHFDDATQTYWFAKPDKIRLVGEGRDQYVCVDDTKSGRHRHRYGHLVPFMMGLVVRRSRAWEKFWGVEFNGNVRTRLVYLRGPDGRSLESAEYLVDNIRATLTGEQRTRLSGLESFIREIDETWKRGWFRVQPGPQCENCNFRSDCQLGQDWVAAQIAAHTEAST